MPRDVNGNVTPPPGTIVSSGDTILPSQHNPVVTDYAAMLEQSLSRDGQGGMRAPLNMNGFKLTNVGTATLPWDAVNMAQASSMGTPIGTVVDYAGSNPPEGWLLCYGQSLSRSAYASLFAVIGTTYGSTSGSTFNLPDCRGRVTAGVDNMGGAAAGRLGTGGGMTGGLLGATGGDQRHQLTIDQIPGHTHAAGTLATSTAGEHTHSIPTNDSGGTSSNRVDSGGGSSIQGYLIVPAAGAHTHNITGATSSIGGGQAHPNVQPTIIFNKIIKAQ